MILGIKRFWQIHKKSIDLEFLFKIALHFSIITSRAFWVLWFLRKPVRSNQQICSKKKMFLKILQNSQENTCFSLFLIKLQASGCNFISFFVTIWKRVNNTECLDSYGNPTWAHFFEKAKKNWQLNTIMNLQSTLCLNLWIVFLFIKPRDRNKNQ